jgi:hypothetical protein
MVERITRRSLLLAVGYAGFVLSPLGFLDDGRSETEYQSVLIFRNDDLEPGNEDELRRTVDQIFIDEEIPLTNAPIPTQDEDEPITEDEEFCDELREQYETHPDIFEYSLHGYYHSPSTETFYEGEGGFQSGVPSEFGGLSYDEQQSRIEDGKRILEECLGDSVQTFVPPFGAYDDATVQALEAEDITVVSAGDWFTEEYFGETEPFETYGVLHVPEDNDFVSDWETHEFHDQEYLQDEFDEAYENGDLYIQTLHYWTFTNDDRLEQLRSFIDYAREQPGVLIMTVGAFADAYRDERLVQTDDGWTYTPSVDDEDVAVTDTGPRAEDDDSAEETSLIDSVISFGRRLLGS